MAFLVNGSPIITNDRDLSAVGVATLTEDINIGRLLYDANGNVGAADSVLVTKDNILQWVAPSAIGISTGSALAPGSTYYVTENGSDSNSGDSLNNAWASIGYALTNIAVSGDDVLYIGAGDYTETFPLTVPKGLTVKGAGQRATIIRPTTATETENGFLLNDDTTMEDFSIGDMYKPAGAGNNSYAFSYEVGAAITSRSPYISRVSIINRGSNVSASDPYGYNSADNYPVAAPGAGGVLVDGGDLSSSTASGSFLLNELTVFPVGNKGLEMTNGARVEMLNSFVYFADEGIAGSSDLATGLAGSGRARLTLDNPSATPQVGNTVDYYSSSGTTLLATGTIDEVSGNYVYLTDSGTGEFEVPRNRTPVTVNFVGGAELSTTQARFGPTSLDVTSSNSDAVTAETPGFGFGTGDFTVEGWFYFTGLTSNRFIWDFRGTAAADQRLVLEELGGGDLAVNIGTTQIAASAGGPLTTNTWHHIAVARDGTDFHLYVDGTEEALVTNSTDLGTAGTLHLGADYTDANGMTGFVDDFRVTKGAAKYTGASYTVPTAALTSDANTGIMLHFDGANGDTATEDDIITTQDIRFTGGNTADKITLADYSEFGADLRSIGCAIEYGNKGVVGDGQGVSLRLFAINFNFVGSGGDYSNDPNLAAQLNEVIETNSASVSYVSIDHKGDFRVGESFFVDQETGEISFSSEVTDLTSLSSLTITDGTNSSLITPTSGRFGNIQVSGNQVESTTGDLNVKTAGAGNVNVEADLNVTGIISASGVNLASIQNNDTAIALDDTGANGTIRFITDGSEAGRFDNSNDLTVTNNIGAGQTVTASFFEGDGSKLTNISSGSVDLTGTDQSFNSVAITTTTGTALDVAGNVAIGGSVSIGATAYINELVLTEVLDFVGANQAVIGVATVTGDLTAQGNIIGDGATDISGINSVTAANFYGDGSNLSNINADNVDLTGTSQSFANLELTAAGIALTVSNDAEIGNDLTVTNNLTVGGSILPDSANSGFVGSGSTRFGIVAAVAGNFELLDADDAIVTGVATVNGNIVANGDIVGDTATNISGINSVTADNFYGDGSGLTNISSGSVDLTGTDQSLNSLVVTGPGIALTVTNDVAIGGSMSIDTIYAQNYDSLSDRKLKDDITVLDDALGSLAMMDGVSYVWKNNGRHSIGVVAQEVREVYPELVTEGDNLTVNYNGLVGVLLRAVKELNAKVDDLQRQLDEK